MPCKPWRRRRRAEPSPCRLDVRPRRGSQAHPRGYRSRALARCSLASSSHVCQCDLVRLQGTQPLEMRSLGRYSPPCRAFLGARGRVCWTTRGAPMRLRKEEAGSHISSWAWRAPCIFDLCGTHVDHKSAVLGSRASVRGGKRRHFRMLYFIFHCWGSWCSSMLASVYRVFAAHGRGAACWRHAFRLP